MVDATTTSEPQSTETSNSQVADVTTVGTKNVPKPEPNPLVICGPSGSGKSTILKNVMSQPKYKVLLLYLLSILRRWILSPLACRVCNKISFADSFLSGHVGVQRVAHDATTSRRRRTRSRILFLRPRIYACRHRSREIH